MSKPAETVYTSRREAQREIVAALWGEVPFAKRPCLLPEPGTYSIVATANVNGRDVAFLFDNYGRLVESEV